jgi:hypothetical protein
MASELENWASEVAAFGGRVGSPMQQALQQQLASSQLGIEETYDLTAANPSLPAKVLASLKLERPIPFDLTFQRNTRPPQGGQFIDPGNGFCRVTWGVPGAPQMTADIDAGEGWRHPFVASFLELRYIPSNPEGSSPPPGGQPRKLTVAASIAPQANSSRLRN